MSKTPISDSVVFITGASSGIGRATALQFARNGSSVVLVSRQQKALDDLAEECRKMGGDALPVTADVSDENSVQNAARQAVEKFGKIDVWVNNAAVAVFGKAEDIPSKVFRRVMDTNFFGCVNGSRAAISQFRRQGSGVLINVSSMDGRVASPFLSPYVASKFAISGFTEALRMELRDAPNIHVCLVLPSVIDTPLYQHAANFSGRALKTMKPVNSAKKVATDIVEMARNPKRETVTGTSGRMLIVTRVLAQGVAENLIARQVEKDQFVDQPVPASQGNLFEPMSNWNKISGGWKEQKRKMPRLAKSAMGVALVGLGVGLGVAGWQKHRTGKWKRIRRLAGI